MSAALPASVRSPSHASALWPMLRCAVAHWSSDQAATIGAALAFYCAFSIAPLLVILLTVAGWIVGAQAAYGHVASQLTALFGKPTAEILLQAVRSSQTADGTSTALAALREAIGRRFTEFVVLAGIVDFVISVGLVTGLIALIYRYLPARRMPWRPILWGALVTALLFHLGRWGSRGTSAARRSRPRSARPPRSRPCCCGCTTPRRSSCSAPSSLRASAERATTRGES